ncbi:hypothetical protein [Lentzea tibetensis]|uniref:hypothetical protein n=1 Tax=Lentzea tibetensis TaxID=2591470 RepID=UPI001C99C14C|nr:hypothetical protein [Lentzea tibetensis]
MVDGDWQKNAQRRDVPSISRTAASSQSSLNELLTSPASPLGIETMSTRWPHSR